MSGFVSIVGAGPWDPELLTLAGLDRLRRADVVVADYLVNPALLLHAPGHAELHQRTSGPRGETPPELDQASINALLVERAQAGKRVVRLKGGDPCMFGRGGEEAQALARAGVAFELVPGVSSPIAAPEAAGIPVTHRDHTPAVTFVSGWEAYDKAGLQVQWEHLARSAGTIVLMMSVRNARENAQRLIAAGRAATTPAAAVRWGTRGIQRTVTGTLADIADRIDAEGLRAPAVLVVGEVVELRKELAWVEARPLFGRRVAVARADDGGGELVRRLAAAGADAVAFPCLRVLPPEDPAALARAVAGVDAWDVLIVSSRHGAEAIARALADAGLDVRALAGKIVAAIGTGTAAACRARGLAPDIVPDDARSEGLVDRLGRDGLLSRRVLHVRADSGRDVLARAVEASGGTCTLAVAYRTVRPPVPAMLVQSLRARDRGGEGLDAICVGSGKAMRHLVESLREHLGETEAAAMIAGARLVAIGPATAAAIEAMGLSVAAIASAPDDDAMVDAVARALAGSA